MKDLTVYLRKEVRVEIETTVTLAGREVTLAQKPHVEADIRKAAAILTRLASREIEVDS